MYFIDETTEEKKVSPKKEPVINHSEWTTEEIVYFAAILDCGTYIFVNRSDRGNHQLRFTFRSNDQYQLDWLSSRFGGTVYNKGLKRIWMISITEIADAMSKAYKYQISKKELSKIFLKFLNTMVQGEGRLLGDAFKQASLQRNKLCEEFKRLSSFEENPKVKASKTITTPTFFQFDIED